MSFIPSKQAETALMVHLNGKSSPDVGPGCARASEAGRCGRAVWYRVREQPRTNPPDLAAIVRMRIGTHLGADLAAALAGEHPRAIAEQSWRVGSVTGHCDLVYQDRGTGRWTVCEFKTVNPRAWNYLDQPKVEHILQLQMNAYGLDFAGVIETAVQAPLLRLTYLAVDPREDVTLEHNPAYQPGAAVAEIARLDLAATAAGLPVRDFDPEVYADWQCRYCSWHDRCLEDGEQLAAAADVRK